MKTPFTTEQFFSVFKHYNYAIFPGQIFILVLGLLAILLMHTKKPAKDALIGSIIGILWIWIGAVYHVGFFAVINPVARIFGGIFIFQGLLILYTTFKNRLHFALKFTAFDYLGYFFILFGIFIYPIIGWLLKGDILTIISLGLPCPTTIFTFGFFIMARNQFPKYLLIIPTLWAVVGLSAAVNFGVYQDVMIIISAIIAILIIFKEKKIAIKYRLRIRSVF